MVEGVGEVYAGTVVSGTVSVGDRLLLGPAGPDSTFLRTAVASVHVARLAVRRASAGQTASFTLVADPIPYPSDDQENGHEEEDEEDEYDGDDDRGTRVDRRRATIEAGEAGNGKKVVGASTAVALAGKGRGPSAFDLVGGDGDVPMKANDVTAGQALDRGTLLATSRRHNATISRAARNTTAVGQTASAHNGGICGVAGGISSHRVLASNRYSATGERRTRNRNHIDRGDMENSKGSGEEAGTAPGDGVTSSPPLSPLPRLVVPSSPDAKGLGGTSSLILDGGGGGESPSMRSRKGMVLIEVRHGFWGLIAGTMKSCVCVCVSVCLCESIYSASHEGKIYHAVDKAVLIWGVLSA